jgi:hypothetical protein
MSRQDQYSVTLTVRYNIGGASQVRSFTMDGFEGGEVDSEDTKFYPGGLAEQISLGGRRTVGNVTVSKLYDTVTDHPNMGWLMGGVGKADCTVVKALLNVDGASVGNVLTYTGKLKRVEPPAFDSESTDAGMWEVEVSSAAVAQA